MARTPVEHFRPKAKRPPIHPAELRLLWLVAAQLSFLPWALGGMREWAQWISLGLAGLAFVASLKPRNYEGEASSGTAFRLHFLPRLLRFPVFWLGLVFLVYAVVGGFNPAWQFKIDGKAWWMEATAHTTWLPAGVQVPFERWGPWRMLMTYAAVWMTVCAVWIGFTRRRTFQMLFTVLAANAFLLAALGIAQRALGADKMFWLWKPPAAYFVSSFIYKNHAGAYFNLVLALCAGLAFWHYERSARRLDKSSPAGLYGFLGTAVAMIVFFSYSRTATLLMFAFLGVAFAVFIWKTLIRPPSGERQVWMTVLLAIGFLAFARIGIVSLGTERFMTKMAELRENIEDTSPGTRTLAAKATLEMANERLFTGWGAGSFRFVFPIYQQKHPAIFEEKGRRLYFEHAHNDYAEFLAEFGIVGCALLAASLLYALGKLARLSFWQNPLAVFVVLGCLVVALHSAVDFNFYNPAILGTWWVLLFATIRWLEREEDARAQAPLA